MRQKPLTAAISAMLGASQLFRVYGEPKEDRDPAIRLPRRQRFVRLGVSDRLSAPVRSGRRTSALALRRPRQAREISAKKLTFVRALADGMAHAAQVLNEGERTDSEMTTTAMPMGRSRAQSPARGDVFSSSTGCERSGARSERLVWSLDIIQAWPPALVRDASGRAAREHR